VVESSDTLEPADDISDMRAKNATVAVHFIDDHIAQPAEELMPESVMRQNALVQHIRISDENGGVLTNFGALLRGRITIVNSGVDIRIQYL